MIALDGSALLAILLNEDEADRCVDAISEEDDLIISAASLAEALIVGEAKGVLMPLRDILARSQPTVVPLTAERAYAAALAYERWGKGYHRARLSIMDVFAYSAAREFDCPLLFVGKDFPKTDIRSALQPTPSPRPRAGVPLRLRPHHPGLSYKPRIRHIPAG